MWFAGSIALGQYVFPFSIQLPDDLPGITSQRYIYIFTKYLSLSSWLDRTCKSHGVFSTGFLCSWKTTGIVTFLENSWNTPGI